jgi:shikimate O-hydroxycinnamoyltransferase
MACNYRQRLDPPLPATYFGNAIFYIMPELNVKVVKTAHISEIAKVIRTAVNAYNDSTIRQTVNWLREKDQADVPFSLIQPNSDFAAADMGMTSWANYPTYSVDFGWGKPLWFGLHIASCPGLLMLLPAPDGDGLSVLIHLTDEHMVALRQEQNVALLHKYK